MFFQIDDQLPSSPKHRRLCEVALANGDPTGMAAGFLWTMLGAQCQASLTDGLVSHADALRIVLDPDLTAHCLWWLIEVGLLHEAGHACIQCEPVPPGHYRFHDWWQMNYDRADQVSVTRRKRKELKDAEIINSVWARDSIDPIKPTSAACRYCSKVVKRKDTRSPRADRAQLDHVDPTKAVGARNIVISCGECNQRKGNRTPEQADMVLLSPPRSAGTTEGGSPSDPAERSSRPTGPAERSSRSFAGARPTPPAEQGTATSGPAERSSHPQGQQNARSRPDVTHPTRSAAVEARSSRPDPAEHSSRPQGQQNVVPGPTQQNAGTDHTPTSPRPPEPDQTPTKPDQTPTKHRPPENSCPARGTRAGAGLAGSGQGYTSLSNHAGSSASSVDEPRPRKRRRRGRKRTTTTSISSDPQQSPPDHDAGEPPRSVERDWDAGQAPVVPTAGSLGSPYFAWRGPPAVLDEDTICPDHDAPMPCRKCIIADSECEN